MIIPDSLIDHVFNRQRTALEGITAGDSVLVMRRHSRRMDHMSRIEHVKEVTSSKITLTTGRVFYRSTAMGITEGSQGCCICKLTPALKALFKEHQQARKIGRELENMPFAELGFSDRDLLAIRTAVDRAFSNRESDHKLWFKVKKQYHAESGDEKRAEPPPPGPARKVVVVCYDFKKPDHLPPGVSLGALRLEIVDGIVYEVMTNGTTIQSKISSPLLHTFLLNGYLTRSIEDRDVYL